MRVLVVCLLLAGCLMPLDSQGCPGHWHMGFTVFVDDERVPFTDPSFLEVHHPFTAGSHIHMDDGVYHFHPPSRECIPLGDALLHLGITVEKNAVVLDEVHGERGGAYVVDDEHRLLVYQKTFTGPWKPVRNVGSLLSAQPPPGSAILITYGVLTDERVASQIERARTLEDSPYAPA